MALQPWIWIVLAYFIAAIPVGLLIGWARGIDLREIGSGNIGATNAMRALGKSWGFVVLVLDVLKAGLPVWLAREWGELETLPQGETWLAGVALAAVCGHIFPVYLRFRGGKGVACALGTLLVLAPASAALAFVVYAIVLARTRISALGSLAGVSSGSLYLLLTDAPAPYKAFVVALSSIIWWRHRANLRDLRARPTPEVED